MLSLKRSGRLSATLYVSEDKDPFFCLDLRQGGQCVWREGGRGLA